MNLFILAISLNYVVSLQNLHQECDDWASQHECTKNPRFMWGACRESCFELVTDDNELCPNWADEGECTANPGYIHIHCPVACNRAISWNPWVRRNLNIDEHEEEPFLDNNCDNPTHIMKLAHIVSDRLLAFIYGRNVAGFSTTSPSEFLGMMGLSEAVLYAARLYKIVADHLTMVEESQAMDHMVDDISAALSVYNGDGIMRSFLEWVDTLQQCYLNIVQRIDISEENKDTEDNVCLSIGPEISSLVSSTSTTTSNADTKLTADIQQSSTITLSNGVNLPSIGLGTWQLNGPDCEDAVFNAISLGYRHIDTAEAYGNEADIGKALHKVFESGVVQRSDLFIATKISFESSAGAINVKNLFEKQLRELQLDYIDLYMLHSPLPDHLQTETWAALEELYDAGLIRVLGLSNFNSYEMRKIYDTARIKPMVVQNKWDIYHIAKQMDAQGDNVIATAKELGIVIVGYSPFSSYPFVMVPTEDPIINYIAKLRNVSPSQVVLRWMLQSGAAVIPRSINISHLKDNLEALQLPSLSENEMALISLISHLTSSPAYVTTH